MDRRDFLTAGVKSGIILLGAPAIVHAENLMPVQPLPDVFRVPDLRGHFLTDPQEASEPFRWMKRWNPAWAIDVRNGEVFNVWKPSPHLILCDGRQVPVRAAPELFQVIGNQYG